VIDEGQLTRIVEAKDATAQELAITTCNSGVICADRATLFDLISKVGNDNASEEFYLTDIAGLAHEAGLRCEVVLCDEEETLGVNSRVELDRAERIFQRRARLSAMENGVTLAGSESIFFSFDTEIAPDVWVGPNVVFGPGVTVDTGAEIHAFSHLEACHVGPQARIGPFARLRPGTTLAREARVGNFVEIKNATVAEGAKVNHLTYIGDAEIGAGANIGAGTVTCNYDGVMKHRTKIGAGAFVGSGSLLVAPVELGADSMTATGTVLPSGKNLPDGAMAIGRAKVEIKPGFARKLMDVLRARKMKKGS
jgi:bifunctional UDP-N-acetylglucosamine pyrophosphorylase/glucosamine-1-phosphate N-acetyltransferase